MVSEFDGSPRMEKDVVNLPECVSSELVKVDVGAICLEPVRQLVPSVLGIVCCSGDDFVARGELRNAS